MAYSTSGSLNKDFFSKNGGKQGGTRNPNIYAPDFSKARGGEYVALLRFLPNMVNRDCPVMSKWVSFLGDPNAPQGKKYVIDNPRSEGNFDNPISILAKELYDTKDDRKATIAKDFLGTVQQFYAFVQVISDAQMPEWENRVLLFKFGKKIWEKICGEVEGDMTPFDLCDGRIFKLVITKQHNNNNYDKSLFVSPKDISNGYRYTLDGQNWYAASSQDAYADQVEAQLLTLESAIDLTDAKYTPWTPEVLSVVEDKVRLVREYAYPELIGATHGVIAGAPMYPGAYSAPTAPQQAFIPTIAQAPTTAPSSPSMPSMPTMPAMPTAPAVAPAAPVAPAPQAPAAPAMPTMPTTQAPQAGFPAQTPSAGFNTDELFSNI